MMDFDQVKLGIVDDINDFAGRFMGTEQSPGNIIASPLGTWTILCLCAHGAEGDTKDEIVKTILRRHPDFSNVPKGFQLMMQQISSSDLLTANGIFLHPSIELKGDFSTAAQAIYNAKVSNLTADPKQSCDTINQFVSQQTKGKINDIVDQRIINTDTRCLFVNTMYFKSNWATAFDKNGTKPLPFNLSDGSTIDVPTMMVESSFRMKSTDQYRMIEIPYMSDHFSMIIVVPTTSMMQVVAMMARNEIDVMTDMGLVEAQRVNLKLPRFSASWRSDISTNLQALGIKDAFSTGADFSGITDATNVRINAMLHQAVIDVSEDGTEAGAGAIGKFVAKSILGSTTDFNVDRPFFFAIKHNDTGVAVFTGRIDNPTTTQQQ